MEQIRINDGSKSYQLVNQDGKEIGIFTFNPADVGIVERYNSVIESLSEVFKGLGAGEDPEAALAKASAEVKAKMDELFGYDTSAFWAACAPLTPLDDGRLYIESVLEGVSGVIEAATSQRMKKVQKHIDKYTKDYRK